VAIAAQGLDRHRPEKVRTQHLTNVMNQLGLLQIDSVQVVERAHLMPLFSRLGAFDRAIVDRATKRSPRKLIETWAHEASLVPPDVYHLLEWRRAGVNRYAWRRMQRVAAEHPGAVARIRALVDKHGPLTSRQVHTKLGYEHTPAGGSFGSWNWSEAKSALEYLFFIGQIASAGRTAQFERLYDLAERVVPPPQTDLPGDPASQQRALIEIAARALGVGTERCLADYFRMPTDLARIAIGALVEREVLQPVLVEGWPRPTYLHRDARQPRAVTARALLSPFDSMVFERRRLEELFGMHYRLEYYLPPARRVWGYYVMPFLLGEQMVGRVDLKADRAEGRLMVRHAYLEPGASPAEVAPPLAAELADLARWLGLRDIDSVAGGELGKALTRAAGS
jgi:uncharacterized protein YcaQ